MNETTLLAYLRRAPFGGRLKSSQIAGIRRILAACERHGVLLQARQAYVLASVFHETGGRMQPVRETFAGDDAEAKRRLEAAWQAGRLPQVRTPYWRGGWFGRGDLQITHLENYSRMGRLLGIDLVAKPALALDPAVSADIAVIGMRDGLFSKGHSLARYFPADGEADAVGARRIVNGTDKAKLIAGHWRAILDAMEAARRDALPTAPARPDVQPEAAQPDDVPAAQSPAAWLTGLGGLATAVIGAVSNPWALAAVAIMAGVAVWAVKTGRISFNRAGRA